MDAFGQNVSKAGNAKVSCPVCQRDLAASRQGSTCCVVSLLLEQSSKPLVSAGLRHTWSDAWEAPTDVAGGALVV